MIGSFSVFKYLLMMRQEAGVEGSMVEWRDPWWSGGIHGGVEGSMVEWRDPWWSGGIHGGVEGSMVEWRDP